MNDILHILDEGAEKRLKTNISLYLNSVNYTEQKVDLETNNKIIILLKGSKNVYICQLPSFNIIGKHCSVHNYSIGYDQIEEFIRAIHKRKCIMILYVFYEDVMNNNIMIRLTLCSHKKHSEIYSHYRNISRKKSIQQIVQS